MPSESQKVPYDITYMWNLDYDTNELMQELEANSQREKICDCQKEGGEDGPGVWHQQMQSITHSAAQTRPYCTETGAASVPCDKQQWKGVQRRIIFYILNHFGGQQKATQHSRIRGHEPYKVLTGCRGGGFRSGHPPVQDSQARLRAIVLGCMVWG